MLTTIEKTTLDAVAAVLEAYKVSVKGEATCTAFGQVLGHMLTPIRKANAPLYQMAANRLMGLLSYEANNALLGVEYSDAPKAPGATFVHDCDECQFLGRVLDENMREYDAYYCKTGTTGVALIARYGHAGADYRSVPMAMAKAFPEPLWNEVRRLLRDRQA